MSQSEPARVLFVQRLKSLRAKRGLSQRGLGDAMGLGKQVGSTRINRYEQQERFPALDDLDLLAATLGVPVAALLAEDDATARVICALQALSSDDRERLALQLEGSAAGGDERG